MNENPLAPVPDSSPAVMETMPESIVLTPLAQQYLNQTGPWIRFFSILMFVVSGFMMLAGVFMVLMGFMGKFASPGPLQGAGPMSSGIGMVFLGPVYFLMAILMYILPAIFLYRYSGAIKTLRSSLSALALEEAMKHQKTFWRYVGIMTSIVVALSLLIGIGVGILAGFLATRSL